MKTSRQSSSTRASSSPSSQGSSTPSDDSSAASEPTEGYVPVRVAQAIVAAVTRSRDSLFTRRRRSMQLVASPVWTITHSTPSKPCQTCPTKTRIVTRSIVQATYLLASENKHGIAICNRCLAQLDLRRQREQTDAETAFKSARRKRQP